MQVGCLRALIVGENFVIARSRICELQFLVPDQPVFVLDSEGLKLRKLRVHREVSSSGPRKECLHKKIKKARRARSLTPPGTPLIRTSTVPCQPWFNSPPRTLPEFHDDNSRRTTCRRL